MRRRHRGPAFELAVVFLVAMGVLVGCAGPKYYHGKTQQVDAEFIAAMALLHKGEMKKGEAVLKRLAAQRPLNVPAHREWQGIRLARFEHFDVIRDYQRLVEELPSSGAAHYLLGRLLYRIEDQRRLFQAAVRLSPWNPWGFQGLAWTDATHGRLGEALHHLNIALAAKPGHLRSRYLMTRVLLAQGRLGHARRMLNLELEQFPEHIELWILAAQLSNQENKLADEFEALKKALTLERENEEARALLLELAQITEDQALGFLVFDFARRIAPDDSTEIDDLSFRARLEHLGPDFDRRRAAARRAVNAGSKSTQVLEDAALDAHGYWRAWSRLYQTERVKLSGPMRALKRLVNRQPAADSLALARAYVDAGFLAYGQHLVDDLERQAMGVDTGPAAALSLRLRRHRRILARIQVLVDRIKSEPESDFAQSLPVFLKTCARIIEEEVGYHCDFEEPVLGLPLVGVALDSSKAIEGTVNGYFRRFNQVMFAGRLDGEPTQAIVFSIVSGPNVVVPHEWPNEIGCHEFIGAMVAVRSEDKAFGDSAGRALFGTYFVDADILMPWQWRLGRITEESPENQSVIMKFNALDAHGSGERLSMAYPGVMAEALVLKAYQLHGELKLLDAVVVHEQGHLRDSFNYLPLWQQFLPNLLLVIRGGFSAMGVMAELEDAAALHALKYCQSPHLVLAELVRSLPKGKTAGPHARGYKNLLARFLIQLDARLSEFKQISPNHVLMQQLHLLSESDIRRIAAAL